MLDLSLPGVEAPGWAVVCFLALKLQKTLVLSHRLVLNWVLRSDGLWVAGKSLWNPNFPGVVMFGLSGCIPAELGVSWWSPCL